MKRLLRKSIQSEVTDGDGDDGYDWMSMTFNEGSVWTLLCSISQAVVRAASSSELFRGGIISQLQ